VSWLVGLIRADLFIRMPRLLVKSFNEPDVVRCMLFVTHEMTQCLVLLLSRDRHQEVDELLSALQAVLMCTAASA
jgi:predicted transcriptional regulator